MENESLDLSSLVDSLKEINLFIKGEEYSALKQHMKKYDNHIIKFKRDFYVLTIYAGEDYQNKPASFEKPTADEKHDISAILAELEILLAHLNIPRHRWGRYLNSQFTLHDILCQLNADLQRKSNIQLNTIIELIEARKSHNKKFYLMCAGSILSFLFVIVSPPLVVLVELAKLIMASTIILPSLSVLYSVGSFSYYAYENHFDKKRSLFNRLRDNAFLVLSSALNVSANIVWLASATVVAPLASGVLFILASVVDIGKEVFSMVQNYLQYKKYLPFAQQDLHDQQEHARYQFGYRQHRNAAIINIIAALFLFAIMVAWQLVPGGIFVTIGAVAAMCIVYQLQKMAVKSTQSYMRDQLQNELRHLEQEYENNNQERLDCSSFLVAEPSLEENINECYSNVLIAKEKQSEPSEVKQDIPKKQKVEKNCFNFSQRIGLNFFKASNKNQSPLDEANELNEKYYLDC